MEKEFSTPYYLIDEALLLKNMQKIQRLKEISNVKCVLALKCFSTWSVFPLMKEYMDGTTSSSLFEARLGYEKFGKEVHAYSVAWSEKDILEIKNFATKVIFNSHSQLEKFYNHVNHILLGIRINPGVSHSEFDLADPARKYSRLGVVKREEIQKAMNRISGAMFHVNCENDDLKSFERILNHIEKNYKEFIKDFEWVSLGGGIYFTKEDYPLEEFGKLLKEFSIAHNVQVYLEPGETAITMSGFLVTSILDIVENMKKIAIVDAAVETHMLDLLIYNTPAKMLLPPDGKYEYIIAGKTCLAGDEFGTYFFPNELKIGDKIIFADAAGYTMVKKKLV
ncbi:MAG: carboxynorspermidine decarboxylase [Leptospiraceae bacterium]|nr:carboxynorspermidine decarboxylase [Leptospiraceae bacterium]